ncbi:MAG TPA: protein kinase [Kofleriaceae bacterium]|nr:protein kinase [Kofleriaceae bacterium]
MPADDHRDDPGGPATVSDRPARARRDAQGALARRFRHVREIARGGMGRVVEAFDEHLGRTVAVKQSLDDYPAARLRFEREVAITARLEHPSIVPVYDAGVSPEGDPFYVMRKVSGAPLDRLIRDAGSLDERLLLLPHVLAVADAVAHAHRRGVIHRDLKPSNVLVGELGETVVIDWGLAKIVDEADVHGEPTLRYGVPALETIAGTVIGTPGFMAPEQVAGRPTDARTDVYALGACLYYALAGKPPIHGAEREVLARTVEGKADSLAKEVPGVPSELVTIVEKAMALDPAARYLDAGGLGEDLRRFLGGQLVASHRYRRHQRLARWIKRHRAPVVAAAVGLAIAITVGIVSLARVLAAQARTEAALEAERERTDELVISQATAHLDTDPTRALATLQQLRADSRRWRTLGAMLADARNHGVAVAYPGHGRVTSARFALGSRDEDRVLSSGNGIVRVHDLKTQTTKTIYEGGNPLLRSAWCGELVVIATPGQPPLVVDPASGRREPLTWEVPISTMVAGPGVLALIDAQRRVATLELRGVPITTHPVLVPGAEPADTIDLSPSGRWLFVHGPADTQVFRRAGASWQLAFTIPLSSSGLAFDAGERHVALIVDLGALGKRGVVEWELATGRETQRWPQQDTLTLRYAEDTLYALGARPGDVRRLADDGAASLVPVELTYGMSLDVAGDTIVVLQSARRVLLGLRGVRHVIDAPIDLFGVIAHGHYLVGLGSQYVLVWDLAPILTTRADLRYGDRIGFLDDRRLIVGGVDGEAAARVVDALPITPAPFAFGAPAHAATLDIMIDVAIEHGGLVIARDPIHQQLRLVVPQVALPADVSEVAALGDRELLVGTMAGELVRMPRDGGAATPITKLDGTVAALAVRDRWIAAQTSRSVVWRQRPDGAIDRTILDGAWFGLAIGGDGTVYAGVRRDLYAWRVGSAAPAIVARLEQDVLAIRPVVGDRIAVTTIDGTLYLHDPTRLLTRPVFRATNAVPATRFAFSDNGTVAAAELDGGLAAIDLATGEHWMLARSFSPAGLAISPDGRSLVAIEQRREGHGVTLHRFALELPPATRAWVDAATNALPPQTARGELAWRLR